MLLDGKRVLLLCSNNYLGLADHPRVREAAARAAMRYGVGAGASRLVSGNMTLHRRLEERLADFKGTESCLLFGSGYLANTGVIAALAREGDVVFSDELNHASIVDGCRLARAETFVYDHLDVEHLEWGLDEAGGRGSLIVTDGVFSMDGDVAPLEEIVELARRYDARVLVDEAHATGVLGPGGRGSVAAAGLSGEVDVVVGTLGKALGGYGAYVCCNDEMARYLVNTRAHADLLDRPRRPRRSRRHWRRSTLLQEQPRQIERLRLNVAHAAGGAGRRGLPHRGRRDADRSARDRRLAAGDGVLRARAEARRVRAGDPPADGARGKRAAAPGRDGDPHAGRVALGGEGAGRGSQRGGARAGRSTMPMHSRSTMKTLTSPRFEQAA